jgi:hypothetical protein
LMTANRSVYAHYVEANGVLYRLRVISSAEPAWATNGSRCAAGG